MSHSFAKKDEDSDAAIFLHLDRTTVLQQARVFNATPVRPRQCRVLLAKILSILYQQGGVFSRQEATELFFSVTKLFQSSEPSLRQMVYLVIKELSKMADDVIMITASLMKDMQPKSELTYRANAIRALCCITDPSMLQGVERFLKAAVVDRAHQVSSAALVGVYHFHHEYAFARDVIRRWSNEVQEAATAKGASGLSAFMGGGSRDANQGSSHIVQYHALGLLYGIRERDRMSINKMIAGFSGKSSASGMTGGSGQSTLKSPLATCLLIRYACKVMEDDPVNSRDWYELLESNLRNRSEMVSYEAARAICLSLPEPTSRELYPAVNVLQLMLASQKATLRFAAVRTLNALAQRYPEAVQQCNADLPGLVTDSNRSIATLAITTLLKTGNESSVDLLTKQIAGFMNEITDEFRVIVVNAVRSICLKFPGKHSVILEFLSGVLRDEGGYEFKKEVVEAIFDICKAVPDAKPIALTHLCEFIEDCEFPRLTARVLHFLGIEGPHMPNPTVYVRHIYNRVVLENAMVRASAVSALAKFGLAAGSNADLHRSVLVLLKRCLEDPDDEVRDRAALYVRMLSDDEGREIAPKYLNDRVIYSLAQLERQLAEYCANLAETADKPFSTANIQRVTKEQVDAEEMREKESKMEADALAAAPVLAGPSAATSLSAAASKTRPSDRQEMYAKQLADIPEFATFGSLFKSSLKPIPLTESETEYVVHCVKHTFSNHVVFQFDLRNTINDQLLENVAVIMSPAEDPDPDTGLLPCAELPCPSLPYDTPGTAYVAFKRSNEDIFPSSVYACSLKFVVKDCDPSTGEPDPEGYEDEYQVEDVDVSASDYMLPSYLGEFDAVWRELAAYADECEHIETFELGSTTFKSLQDACSGIIDVMGIQPLHNTDMVKEGATTHQLKGQGLWVGGVKVVVWAKMAMNHGNITMQVDIRSERGDVSEAVMSVVG